MNKQIAFIFSARSIAFIINLIIAAILGYKTVQILLMNEPFFKKKKSFTSVSSDFVTSQSISSQAALDISTIFKSNLFGKNNTSALQIAKPIANTPPKTALNLKLQGIYYSSKANARFAMITTTPNQSQHYRIGDALPGGAIIHDIKLKELILLRNSRYETLPLIGLKTSKDNKFAKMMQEKKSNIPNVSPEQLLGQYQRQLQTNPNRLMKLMRISPVTRKGRLLGYRLRPGKESGLLSRFHLESGDILTAINGIKLDSPIKGLSVIQQLATVNQVNLQLLRRGQPLSLSFSVEK